jgi:hypothetical protein
MHSVEKAIASQVPEKMRSPKFSNLQTHSKYQESPLPSNRHLFFLIENGVTSQL